MSQKIHDILAELRRRLGALYGNRLVSVILFGSQARDDAEPDSDIDVMLVLKDPVHREEEIDRVIPITAELSLENDVVISTTYMSAERYAHEQSSLLLNVRKEGVPV